MADYKENFFSFVSQKKQFIIGASMQPIHLTLNITIISDGKESIEIMASKTVGEREAERILKEEEEQNRRSENHRHKSEVFKLKAPELWNQLCQTLQREFDGFNSKFSTDDSRRFIMQIDGNEITARRQNNYPLTELVVELRFDFKRIDYRTRIRQDAGPVKEPIQNMGNVTYINIYVDAEDNLNLYAENKLVPMEAITGDMLTRLTTARW